jgi:hypothetical protein
MSTDMPSGWIADFSYSNFDQASAVLAPAGSGARSLFTTEDGGRNWQQLPAPAG